MTTKALHLHNIEQKIIWLLMSGILVMSFLYIYFVNSSIIYTAIREENKETIGLIQTEVSALVSDYITLSGTVDLVLASELGFVDASKKASFALRGGETVTLTLLNNEI